MSASKTVLHTIDRTTKTRIGQHIQQALARQMDSWGHQLAALQELHLKTGLEVESEAFGLWIETITTQIAQEQGGNVEQLTPEMVWEMLESWIRREVLHETGFEN